MLNCEKCHFMVQEGIVFGHKVSSHVIEIDPVIIDVIRNLLVPKSVTCLLSFLGHVGFYRRLIQDFSKIAKSYL